LTVSRSLELESLVIRGFRNLDGVELSLGPRFNVVFGDNGQGKTNLLEAVYVLATSRSFRTAKLGEIVAAGGETASVRAGVREDGVRREQAVGLRRGIRAARVDGKRPPTLAEYAVRTPAVVFHAGALALSAGSGSERRKLLDRVALYRSPASLADLEGYTKALRGRQRVLETRGESAPDLEDWESLVVRHGTALTEARAAAAAALLPAARRAYARIGPPGVALDARYEPGAPEDAAAFRERLARDRPKDRARRSAGVGPHRDDVRLELGERPVRGIASQGQHRSVVLALQLAEIDVIASSRGARPILLLDDVSSELDRARTSALFDVLREDRGQVVLTTTRPALIETGALAQGAERRDFRVVAGRVEPL